MIYILFISTILYGCLEPFTAETRVFEGALVVDARLTNEEKQHQVLLSRARPFEQDSILTELNANVAIVESTGTRYEFEEMAPGTYVSIDSFGAKTDLGYQLLITTAEGESYSSTEEIMPENVPIAAMTAVRGLNDLGEEGVSIVLDNSSLGNQPRYFRYDFDEAYKIIAPNFDPFEFDIIDDIPCADGDGFEVDIKVKPFEKNRVCWGQKSSTEIILGSTEELQGSDLTNFLIRFISRENYVITHRYTILVNQYTQSVDAHSYYQGLQSFSTSGSVFSEIQPGFLAGNILSETNTEEKVIGFFETAAVSSRRIYFNYEDLFPDEELPEYPINCSTLGNPSLIPPGFHCTPLPDSFCDGNCISPLIEAIKADLVVFAAEKEPADFIAPYLTLPFACGDCTALGSNVKPDFWID